MTIDIWKKKLTECEPYFMSLVDQEMKDKGYTIKPGLTRQFYFLHHEFYDHKAMITFDIINRRWVSALIDCIEPIALYNDPIESEIECRNIFSNERN